jgi:opacity protein-like surface antigen
MRKTTTTLATAVLAAGLAAPAAAQDAASSEQRLQELERKVDALSAEVEGKRREGLVSEEYDYQPAHGVGSSGAKVYSVDQGLSIGGYGHGYYRDSSVTGDDQADFYRNILYIGYKFNDWILLNTEIELEHADAAYQEFAYLDFLLHDAANVRAGLMLSPLGIVNEVHEPATYFGNIRPAVEKSIIPTTARENGAGLYGNLTDSLEYRLYVQNSFDGIDDGASNIGGSDLRGIRQKGSKAEADDLAVTGRLDWRPASGVLLGGSFWSGDMGHDQELFKNGNTGTPSDSLGTPDIHMNLYEAHAQYKVGGLWLRGLFAQAQIDDADKLSESLGTGENVGETMTGWYAEAGYDIMPLIADRAEQSLYPWVRYTDLDTQASMPSGYDADPANDRTILEAGLHYMPHPNVVIKAEYKDYSSEASAEADNNHEEVLAGIGYNF